MKKKKKELNDDKFAKYTENSNFVFNGFRTDS
jgi:hypothetical protein